MNFKTFASSIFALLWLSQKAHADIRRVFYMGLNEMDYFADFTPAEDTDCRGSDPFAGDWKGAGLQGGCSVQRIPSAWFYLGKKVEPIPQWGNPDVAILSFEEILALKEANPTATFRFELKAAGSWQAFATPKYYPMGLFPSSLCVSDNRFTEIKNLYKRSNIDWESIWYIPRSKFAAPDDEAYETKEEGLRPFNMFFHYDFDISECDLPLTLRLVAYNYAFIKFNYLEVNLYICQEGSCASIPKFSMFPEAAFAALIGEAETIVSPQFYADTNPDIKAALGNNAAALYNQWNEYGRYEGRIPSPGFDPVFYLNNNPDLKAAFGTRYAKAARHWFSYGLKECRQGSANFNPMNYLNRNADLKAAFGNDCIAAYRHYITYGFYEGRDAR